MNSLPELWLAQVWNDQWLTRDLRTTNGACLRVVYRGVWTHGLGPDFTGAFLDIDGKLLNGAVEVHHHSSGWLQHGHHLDPAYNVVELHVVLIDDLEAPVRRNDGYAVPTLQLDGFLPGPVETLPLKDLLRPLGAIGFAHCAPDVAAVQPDAVRRVWTKAGDVRMTAKVASVSGRLALDPPGQVAYALLLDALGYMRNREPMAAIAARLPWDHLEPRLWEQTGHDRFDRAAGLLLGIGGFLPLTPREAEFAALDVSAGSRIERAWEALGTPWRDVCLLPTAWNLARLRPAAHPLRRLLAIASLLSRLDTGLVEDLCAHVERADSYPALLKWLSRENPYLGEAHAHETIVNVVVPFGLAYGEAIGHDVLIEASARLWETIPAGRGNADIRRTIEQICGPHRVPVRSARAEQGLLHLQRTGCSQMRCFECPIAHLTLSHRSSDGSRSS